MLSAESLLGYEDLKFEDVVVPQWGDQVVRMRELGAGEALEFTEEMEIPENKHLGMYLIIIKCAVNEDGSMMFPLPEEKEARGQAILAHVAGLRKKSLRALNLLQRAALRVNNMLPENAAALKKD